MIRRPAGLLLLVVVTASGASVPAAAADPPAILPDVAVHLTAARYEPTETDLHWDGWIGADVGVVRVSDVTFAFDAAVETTLGNTRRAFEATQANYHLTLSLRRPFGALTGALVFHHVSRHYIDREKDPAVDWNVLGLRLGGPLAGRRGRWQVGVGHTTLASLVGYQWEATAMAEAAAREDGTAPFGHLEARLVTIGPRSLLDRGDFVDLLAEGGLRVGSVSRNFQLFAAFERRNDVFLEVPGRRNRALFGFRINYLAP
jgi:hypothetical protein